MADKVSKVQYAYVMVPDRKGQGARVLRDLTQAGVNMLAFTGFPAARGKAQIVIVPARMAQLQRVARRHDWKLSATKQCFHVTGKDRVGAVESHLSRLARAGVSITASSAAKAAKGAYSLVVWVKSRSFKKAAKALRAR